MFAASSHLIGIMLALAAAAVWGSGDFAGGRAARRSDQFQVMVLVALSGIVLLSLLALVFRESLPSLRSLGWALAAGSSGAIGLAALFRGLSIGRAAVVSPTTAVVGASIPVLYGFLTEGLLKPPQIVGMLLAVAGLWFVSRMTSTGESARESGFSHGLIGGLGIAGFLILITQVEAGSVLIPLAVARVATLIVSMALVLGRGLPLPGLRSNPLALLAGCTDAGGNVLYLLAQQYPRLDIAAVAGSLYPVVTVIFARILLDQRVSATQWAGIALCLTGVALIAT